MLKGSMSKFAIFFLFRFTIVYHVRSLENNFRFKIRNSFYIIWKIAKQKVATSYFAQRFPSHQTISALRTANCLIWRNTRTPDPRCTGHRGWGQLLAMHDCRLLFLASNLASVYIVVRASLQRRRRGAVDAAARPLATPRAAAAQPP